MSRSRGAVSRVASALMFALAGVAAFVFPEGEAGGISAAGGFAPAQVPTHGALLPEDRYYASSETERYRNPVLCTDLGGTLQEVDGEWVCKGLDNTGTFCIVGSEDAFPCRGLFRRVIECNDAYNRLVLNPFICGAVCRPGATWEVKARGANCEFVIPADEIIAEADRTVDLPNFPDGYTGVLATLQVSLLTFQGTEYESHTLINDRPLGPGVPEANADQLTIAAGNVLGIPEYAPLRTGEDQRVLVAKNSCPRFPDGEGPSFRGFADLGCYPGFVTITANFAAVIARTDIDIRMSVATNLPAAVVTLKTAVGHSGFGYGLSLINTADYALVELQYAPSIHGFDADNGIILIDRPLPAGAPLVADVAADIECRTIPYCNPARISVTVVFTPISAPSQPDDTSVPATDPFDLSIPLTLPDGYAHSQGFIDNIPGFENHVVANWEVLGIGGYDGDTANFAVTDSGNLSNEDSNALLSAGDYVFTIQMTAEDLLGAFLFEVPLNVYPENQIPPSQSIPPAERKIFQAVSPGYAGSIAYFESANSTVGLSTPGPDASISIFVVQPENITVFPPNGVTLFYQPDANNPPAPGETHVLTLSFRSEKMPGSEAVEEDFMVTVTVSIVSVPPQEPLETNDAEDFMHPLVVPGFDLSGGDFIVLSVVNTDTNEEYIMGPGVFAVENGILQRSREGDNPPPPDPGRYDVIVEIMHPDIRGPVTITVAVVVRGFLNPATYNLSGPSVPVLVAPGYAGNLRLEPPANISLSSATPEDTRVDLPAAFPAGVSLELRADSREVAPHLTPPLAAGAELEAVLTLTIARADDLYTPIEQLVTVAVSALALPAVAAAEVIAPSPQNVFAAGGVVADLAAADYENGVYSGADFQEDGVSPELDVNLAGVVTSAVDLAVGDYEFTVVANGRPAASGAQFLGEVEITVSVLAVRGREPIAPDDVVPAAAREVTIDAAVGYIGAGYAIPVSIDYELIQESYDNNVFGYDADGEVILITSAVGDDPFSYVVDAEARCASASGRFCETIDITITANFAPVSAPNQDAPSANYLDGFAHSIALPSGYGAGGVKEDGRALNLVTVGGWTGDLADLSLSIDGETLQYAPGGDAENALTPGQYTIALEMTQTELLGTVAIEVTANIAPRPLEAAEYGLSELPLVTIVPGPSGVGLEIAAATLTGGAAEAVLAIPDPANFPDKISLALGADRRGFTVFVTAAFTSDETAEIGVPLVVSLPDENYAPLNVVVSVTVQALRQPDLIDESASGVPYSESNIANLKTGVFANATFAKVDADSDAELLVDENTGIISTDGDLGVGTYNIVVEATSPDFFGAIRLALRLVVSDRPILTAAQTIPSGERSREIAAAAGYSGSVAFFAAKVEGVTLQTPQTAPSGFNFGGADALNANFVSPEGFTLFLEADQIPNAGDAAPADFEVAASLAGHEGETITLNITVLAVGADQPELTAPESAENYDSHNLTAPAGYAFSAAGTLRIAGAHDTANNEAVADADQRLVIVNNKLQPAGAAPAERLAVGRYVITVAMTHPNFLGTANLLVTADILEELAADNVVPDREVSQLVVVGHSGEGYQIPVDAAYTLANAAYDESQFTLALENYELQIINPMPDSELAATLAADVLCADQSARSCAPLQISLTIAYAPVSPPLLERTERVTVAGSGREDPYNDSNIADLKAEAEDDNFASATFAKVDAESSASLRVDPNTGIISTDGDLFVGAYTLLADATSPDFLGTARASLGLTVRGMLNPAANNDHYGLQGPDRDPVLVVPGYVGDLQELAAGIAVRGSASTRARLVLPSESPAGITVRPGAARASAAPHLTIALAPEETLVAVLTLTVERIGVDNPELYDKLPQLKAVTISALAIPEPALATVAAEPVADIFNAGGHIVSLRADAYAGGFYFLALFDEHADASADLNVSREGAVSAQENLAIGAYEFTVLARGNPPALNNRDSIAAQRFFHGFATIIVSVEVERGAEVIAADDAVPAADRDVNIDAAVGYAGDGYAIPVESDYELIGESWETADFNYKTDGEVIEITTPIAGEVSYVVTAQAGCAAASGRLCEPVDITITATFNPVSAPGQIDIPGVYLSDFAGGISFPPGYETGGPNSANRDLVITAVEGWAPRNIADLSLSFNDDFLEYNPGGVAANALNVGAYTVAFEMTQPDLLGAVPFEVPVDISQRPLLAADYGFSDAPLVAVAPNASPVGLPVAAVALTGGAADAQAALPDEGDFPAKLSLALSADNRGFTVYVSTAFTSGEIVMENIPLTVTRPGGNHAPLEVLVPLTVGALSQPPLIERSATGTPYNEPNLANLKTGLFTNATFAKASGDAELLVDENTGIISTDGDLGAAKEYNIVVDATSPDFFGTVTLSLQLILTDRLVLLAADTIPSGQRAQNIAVAAGYAGSVAYFVASSVGVTLRTPETADVPTGFNFGANGAGADFVSPEGFTLFVEQLDSGERSANFTVAATLAEHEGEDIALNITVAAVPVPAQGLLSGIHTTSDYEYDLTAPAGYSFGGGQLRILGARNTGTGEAVADIADRLELQVGRIPNPVDASDEDARLNPGHYVITVEFTHPGFLGAMNLLVTADIGERLDPDDVVVAAARDVTLPIAVGHSGQGYIIPVSAGYALENHEYDQTDVNLVGNELRVVNALSAGDANLVVALTADVTCADADRNCRPLKLTLTVTYAPVAGPAQNNIGAQFLAAFDHRIVLPFGYADGEANAAGRNLNITGIDGLADISKLSLDIDGDELKYAPNGVESDALNVGQYTITVEMTQTNLLGTVTMEVAANITRAQLAPNVYAIPHLGTAIPLPGSFDPRGIPIVAGEGGNDALIGVAALTDTTGATILGFTSVNFIGTLAPDGRAVTIRTRTNADYAPGSEEYAAFTLTVTRGNPNYANLLVVVSVGVAAFNPPSRLELSALGSPTYTNDTIANLRTGAFSHARYNGAILTQVGAADTDLNFASDTGIVSGTNLTVGTHTLTVDATAPFAVNTRPNFVGFSRFELILTVEAASPEPDNVVADREVTQPVVAGHSGAPGYVIPVAANYTLATPSYDDAQITLADGREVRLVNPMPAVGNVVAALTADVQCVDPSIGLCGPLQISVTITFTPVAVPPLLELSALGTPTYTNDNIANFSEGAYSSFAGGTFTKVEPGDPTDLQVDPVSGIVSGTNLAAGTHALTVDITSADFIGTAQVELVLTVGLASPEPDDVVADREVTQPVAVGHSGAPGYVIPIAANYALANLEYDETQITIANGNEVRLVDPMPPTFIAPNVVAALTADVQCIDASIGACGALKMTVTFTFTPVAVGFFDSVDIILPNRVDPFGTHAVTRPSGYPNATIVIALTTFTGILRHTGVRETTPRADFFALDADGNVVQGPGGFPDAGEYGLVLQARDGGYLGPVGIAGFVSVPAAALGPQYALAATAAAITVVPGYAGMAYETTLQTPDAVVGSPYVVSPDSGFGAGLLGDDTLAIVIEDIVTSGGEDILATIRATIGNRADPDNFQPVGAELELRIAALPPTPATVYTVVEETYNEAAIHDFRTIPPFENATFQEHPDENGSPQLTVTPEGVVGTQVEITESGAYAITVLATDADKYVGAAPLTLSLILVGTDSNARPDELLAAFAPSLNVAEGESGELHRLEPLNGYSFNYDAQDANPELVLDSNTGAISIPDGETMGTGERRVTLGAEVVCPAGGLNPRNLQCVPGQRVSIAVFAGGVANPSAEFSVYYDEPGFAEAVPLPAGYAAEALNITLSGVAPQSAENGFGHSAGTLTLNADDFPFVRGGGAAHEVTFALSHPAPNLAGEGFWGTLFAEINLTVQRANPPTIPAAQIGTGNSVDERSIVVVAPGVADATLRAWFGSEGGTPGAVAEFRAPLAKTEFGNARYFSELSADRRTLFLSLNPENDTVANLAVNGGVDTFLNIGRVTLVGPGDDSANYAEVVQPAYLHVEHRAAPSASPDPQLTAPVAANTELFDFSDDETGGYNYATDFANATFAKVSGSAELIITPGGVVENSAEISAAGNFNLVAEATSDDWVGTARVSLALRVISAQDVLFAGEPLRAPVAGSPQTIVVADIVEESDAETNAVNPAGRDARIAPAKSTLYYADMVYHGVWRGLHWVYGEGYLQADTSGEGTPATRAADSSKTTDVLKVSEDWFEFSVCEAGGEGWRLPRFTEVVGGVLDGDGGTATIPVRGGLDGPIRVAGLVLSEHILRTPYPDKTAQDTALGPLPADKYYNSTPIFSGDSVTGNENESLPTGLRLESGATAPDFREGVNKSGVVVCVRDAGGGAGREWAIALTESDGVPATVAMNAIGESAAVAVGATVYLGVFNQRLLETPITLTSEMRADNNGKAADLRMARHDVYGDYFRFGLFPVSGGGAALSVWALPNAENLDADIRAGNVDGFRNNDGSPNQGAINAYINGETPIVLEIGFAPDGDYYGHAQFPESSSATEDGFDALKLTVTFTPPPPPPPPPAPVRFEFGGESVSVVGQAVNVAVNDAGRSFSGAARSDVVMEYFGTRGGLEVMRSASGGYADSIFGQRLCRDEGGAGWRNAKITEVAMLATAPSVTELTATVPASADPLAGFPVLSGGARDLVMTFPELGPSETAVGNLLRVEVLDAIGNAYRISLSGDGSAAMPFTQASSGTDDLVPWLCVRETDAYDPSPHHHLAGIRYGDESFDRDNILIEVLATTAPQSSTRSAFTITAFAWHYSDLDPDAFLVLPEDMADEPISARLENSADSSMFELFSAPVNNQPGELEVVVFLKDLIPLSGDDATVGILFETELGDPRTLTLTVPAGSGGPGSAEAAVEYSAGTNGALSAESAGVAVSSGDNVTVDRVVKFTATPDPGYYVSAWTGDADGEGCATGISETDAVDCHIRVPSGGLSVGVSFAEVPPLLAYSAGVSHSGGGRIIAAHDGALLASGARIANGDVITLTATPADGFHLLYWEGDGTDSCASGASQTGAADCEVTAGDSGVDVEVFFNDVHESELTALCTEAATGNADALRIRTVKGYVEGATPDGSGDDIGAVCIFGSSDSPLSDVRTCFAPGNDYRASTHAILHDNTGTVQDLSAAPFCSASGF